MTRTQSRPKRSRAAALLLALLGLAALLAAGLLLAALAFFGRPRLIEPDRLRVAIQMPSSGAHISVQDSVTVMVQSSGPGPVTRYELWVDGGLERVVTPEAGEPALPSSVQISWRPLEPGPRILMARAFGPQGESARSHPVIVQADSPNRGDRVEMPVVLQTADTLESMSAIFELSPEEILAANPDWTGEIQAGREISVPVPISDLPPDFVGDDRASIGERGALVVPLPPAPSGDLPSRPGIPAVALEDGCRVALRWDPSERADGYRIYRYGGGDIDFTVQGEAEEPAFEDRVPLSGGYQYLIAAFNARGTAEGDPAALDVPADRCRESAPQTEGGQSWLDFELLSFSPDDSYERAYCYMSLAPGLAYVRIPAGEDEFLSPNQGQWNVDLFASGINRFGFLQPTDQPVRFGMQCWAWQAGDLIRLGTLDLAHARNEWDGRDLTAAADRFSAIYRLFSHTNEIPQLSSPVSLELAPPPPVFFRRPDSPDDCLLGHTNLTDFADEEARREAWAGVFACLAVDTQQLAVWDWSERPDPRYLRADLMGFRLYYDRLGREPADIRRSEWDLYGEVKSATQVYPLLEPPCEQTYTYWAVAYGAPTILPVQPGDSGAEGPGFNPPDFNPPYFNPPIPDGPDRIPTPMESVASNTLTATGPACPEIQEVLLDITLDYIDVGHTWESCFDIDGECEDLDLEGYGNGTFYRIHADGSTDEEARVVFWVRSAEACGMGQACLFDFGWVRAHHRLNLADENMQVTDVEGRSPFGVDNNHIRVWVGDGEAVGFDFALWDDDDDSGNDIWCGTSDDADAWGVADKDPDNDYKAFNVAGARTADNWATFDHETGEWTNSGLDHQDAECTVGISVTAVEVAR